MNYLINNIIFSLLLICNLIGQTNQSFNPYILNVGDLVTINGTIKTIGYKSMVLDFSFASMLLNENSQLISRNIALEELLEIKNGIIAKYKDKEEINERRIKNYEYEIDIYKKQIELHDLMTTKAIRKEKYEKLNNILYFAAGAGLSFLAILAGSKLVVYAK